ncbi:MAG: hypothetical protein AMXMBFR58_05710 [Phycisphaerae bacterium]
MSGELHVLKHAAVTDQVLKTFYEVYGELGPGFLESVYETSMAMALTHAGLAVRRQHPVAVHFRGSVVGEFRADLLVNDVVLLELKAASNLSREHEAQLINYLRATPVEVGLLLNFGPRPVFKRFAFDNERKRGLRPVC